MEFGLIFSSIPGLLKGTILTLELFIISLVVGMCLALPLAILRVQKNPFLWRPVHWYIYFFRGTPLLSQLFLIYYGLAQLEFIRASFLWAVLGRPFGCAIIAFSLCSAAYTANIIRGGIEAVSSGEVEAARACGMSEVLLYRRILLPCAFRLALPAYGNEVVGMVKATALVSTITLVDLTGASRIIVARTFAAYELFISAALIYLFISFILTRIINFVEKRLNRHLQPIHVQRSKQLIQELEKL